MRTPFDAAMDAREALTEAEGDMMFAVGGDVAFEPFDEILLGRVLELIDKAADATLNLSPRAREARHRLIWNDFLAEQKQLRKQLS